MNNLVTKTFVGAAILTVATSASALPVDYSTLLTAADFSTTTAAIISIASIMSVMYVAWKGTSMVLAALRR